MNTERLIARLEPSRIHMACASAALLCCVPLLFPNRLPQVLEGLVPYFGAGILAAVGLSLLVTLVTMAVQMSKLHNLRALGQLAAWAGVWCCAVGAFVLLALVADVPPPPVPQALEPIQTTDTQHKPNETLLGPSGLALPVSTDNLPENRLVDAPNLTKLENDHENLLKSYIDRSPRWEPNEEDDTFYSKPGHLVFLPPTVSGTPGLVHAAFRRLVGGSKLPGGFKVAKPGEPVPLDDTKTHVSDVALDLGRDHYLLLAWRGVPHVETATKALNAAIKTVDDRMAPLAKDPTHETLLRMLNANQTIPGTNPEMRLCSPPAQEGCYQAEFYVNPHEPGTLQIFFRRMEDNFILRTFTMPARYSEKKGKLFRHDLPGSLSDWARANNHLNHLFPENTPLFVVWEGKGSEYTGVAVELWFEPDNAAHRRRLLLRRCYYLQPYAANQKADISVPAREDAPAPEPKLPDIRRLLPRIMS